MTGEPRDASSLALGALGAAAAALVHPHDVVGTVTDLLFGAVEATGATEAGLVTSVEHKTLQLLAATSHRPQTLDLHQALAGAGPTLEAVRTGKVVAARGADEIARRWTRLAPSFERAGYCAVQAVPLTWHRAVIGALTLFFSEEVLYLEAHPVAQAFADLATVAIVHSDEVNALELARRTAAALDERTAIEQAKGVLFHHLQISMDAAYSALMELSAERGQSIGATAEWVITHPADVLSRDPDLDVPTAS